MAGEDELTYLDTSALVKKYLEEPGSRIVDSLFEDAYTGVRTPVFSKWNLGEAAGVFDKYRKNTQEPIPGASLVPCLERLERSFA